MNSQDNIEILKLQQDFPNTLSDLYYGICIGKGWIDVLRPVLTIMEQAGGQVVAVKEKFGALRIHCKYPKDMNLWAWLACHMAVDEAEGKSITICEKCGQAGVLREDLNWMRTLCDEHYSVKLSQIKDNYIE